MKKERIEEAFKNTFGKMSFYYRDSELSDENIGEYKIGSFLVERGFTDVSVFAAGLDKNTRIAIASNAAKYMGDINPAVAKWGFYVIAAPANFLVLDKVNVEDEYLITLLHIPQQDVSIFRQFRFNAIDAIIEKSRMAFNQVRSLPPRPELYEEAWLERTRQAIGLYDKIE